MSTDDELLMSLAGAIADGSPIDWADAAARLHDPGQIEVLRRLRTLAGLSEAYRVADLLQTDGDEQQHAVSSSDTVAKPSQLTLGGGRFIVTGPLGNGAYGVVYEAYDRHRNAQVAIKRVPNVDVASIYDVKKEFRVLVDLSHPNLVTLYDLFADGDGWFIAMELVRGVDFLTYVCRRDGDPADLPQAIDGRRTHRIADWKRFEHATSQLVFGICYLHEHGKLHGDIKPRNVLVTPEGRVKVLDFGLSTDLVPDLMGESFRIRGTPAYMAPEQAAGEPASEASDWYSVGAMLYEAISGERPFDGGLLQLLEAKQHQDARPLSSLCDGISEPLEALCRDLLDRRPERRPGDADIRARMQHVWPASLAPASRTVTRERAPFVGRKPQLAVLDRAFDAAMLGHPQMVFVRGSSGLGKTALIRRFLAGLREREPGAVLLTGRCYERESVPYKALDSLVDRLSHYLRTLPSAEVEALLPRDVPALTRLFPMLQRVDAIVTNRFRPAPVANAQELRRRSFAAFRELLARLSDRHPVVLVVDDLQWGDGDSAALIADLMFGDEAPPLLFVASYRLEDLLSSAALRPLMSADQLGSNRCAVHQVDIAQLTGPEAYELAGALTGAHRSAGTSIDTIVRESGGSPFLINELIQYSASTLVDDMSGPLVADSHAASSSRLVLDAVIHARTCRLADGQRRLLHTLAIFGGPLRLSVAVEAAGLTGDGLDDVLLLRAAHLTRTRPAPLGEEIEFYHDRIREAVLADVNPEDVPALHARLAAVFQKSVEVDPETLLVHLRGAGQLDIAAEYALVAADRARDAVAFDRAASYYRLALELGKHQPAARRDIEVKLGDALAVSGRGHEAAQAYFAAAEGALAAERLELHRRAADQLLRSGHIDEGLAAIRHVLDALGMELASSPVRALKSVLLRRIWIRLRGLKFRIRDRSQMSAEEVVRVDACWTVATAIGVVDTIRGADYQARHLILALDAGDPFRVARALALDSAYVALGGSRTVARQRTLTELAQRLADQVGQPEMHAYVTLARGIGAFFQAQWKSAHELLERVESMLRECAASVAWELDTAYLYHLLALFYLGDVTELSHRLPGFLKDARDRDDLTAGTNLRTRVAYLMHLAADNPEGAAEEVRQGMEPWARTDFNAQHSWEMYACGEIELYRAEAANAWRLVNENWHFLRRSLLLRIQAVRVESQYLRGRSALAAAIEPRSSSADARLVSAAARSARRLRREKTEWAAALAGLLEAGVSTLRADKARAVDWLQRSEASFDHVDMALHAAAARRRRGELTGGTDGEQLIEAADAWMRQQHVASPERMVAMLAPGRFTAS